MAGPFPLLFFILCFLGSSGAAVFEESVELLTLSSPNPTPTHLPLAISLPTHHLKPVSSSVLQAETWLRTHVLSHYPSSKITHIAVGHNLHCSHHHFAMVLPSLKNLHHSLTRWGLHNEIKLSSSIPPHCLKEDLIKPLLEFIHTTSSTYLINPSQPISQLPTQINGLDIKLILHHQKHRKLSSLVDPYPARPTPLPDLSPSSPLHISYPAKIAKSPLPPLIGSASPIKSPLPPLIGSASPIQSPLPPLIGSASPIESPVVFPTPPPFAGFHLPPCKPAPVVGAAAPGPSFGEKLWCVAKPSVPVETLQEAIDFACGEGGADCGEIQPDGSCYNPDTVIAHASYAFNSYWQKNKRHGGSCGFGGTAMIINADPSFMNCRFTVT